jgi:hypothetical protein
MNVTFASISTSRAVCNLLPLMLSMEIPVHMVTDRMGNPGKVAFMRGPLTTPIGMASGRIGMTLPASSLIRCSFPLIKVAAVGRSRGVLETPLYVQF